MIGMFKVVAYAYGVAAVYHVIGYPVSDSYVEDTHRRIVDLGRAIGMLHGATLLSIYGSMTTADEGEPDVWWRHCMSVE